MAISKAKRDRVYRRDNGTCQYCGVIVPENDITLDHVIPISESGSDLEDNLKVSCRRCNSSKGARSVEYLRHHRQLQLSKYSGIISVQQHIELAGLGVLFDSLPEYVFHYEKIGAHNE